MPYNKGKSKIGESHIPGQELGMITRSRNLVEDQGIVVVACMEKVES